MLTVKKDDIEQVKLRSSKRIRRNQNTSSKKLMKCDKATNIFQTSQRKCAYITYDERTVLVVLMQSLRTQMPPKTTSKQLNDKKEVGLTEAGLR